MNRKNSSAILAVSVVLAGCVGNTVVPVIDSDANVEKKVESVLSGMTLEEKAGQLVQITSDVISTDGKLDTFQKH